MSNTIISQVECSHSPVYRAENEANGGQGCPLCAQQHSTKRPANDLRAVMIIFGSSLTEYLAYKIHVDGTVEPATKPISVITPWLARHGYSQHGAFLGPSRYSPHMAVFFLRQHDHPEKLSDTLGVMVRPATVRWADGQFKSTRTASDIRRARYRNRATITDLAYVELPTMAARERAYGVKL